MKTNIFSRILKSAPSKPATQVTSDDETVITNFTESYLEAYFDGELGELEERQLEGVLGKKYVQEEMLKRGELRDFINHQSVLSIPSAHDLKQEKKRVWNEIEHELRSRLVSKSIQKEPARIFNFRESLLKSLAAGTACLVVGLIYLNVSSKDSLYRNDISRNLSLATSNGSEMNKDYILVHPREMGEMVRLVRDDSSISANSRSSERVSVGVRELREFERHNALIASLNSDELSDLGASMVRNQDLNANMLTFVSNQNSYE